LDNHSQGFYFEGRFNYEDSLFLTAGFRQDINSEFKDKLTYKVEAAYRFKGAGTKLRVSHATGFRVPSQNELFFPFFGNTNLLPEESTNWEGGIEQKLLDGRLVLGATYFYTDYTNLIQGDPNNFFLAGNVGSATSQGVESSINLEILKDLHLTVLHTWNQAVDDIANKTLAKRPRNTFSATLSHHWLKKLHSLVTVQYRSRMRSGLGPVKGRTLLRAAISYRLNKNWKLTARGENLLDEDYEESFESGTAGISGYAGVTFTF
jgi:vitamin B12 transporter